MCKSCHGWCFHKDGLSCFIVFVTWYRTKTWITKPETHLLSLGVSLSVGRLDRVPADGPQLCVADRLPTHRKRRLRVLHGDREVFSAPGEDCLRCARYSGVAESGLVTSVVILRRFHSFLNKCGFRHGTCRYHWDIADHTCRSRSCSPTEKPKGQQNSQTVMFMGKKRHVSPRTGLEGKDGG